MKKKFNIKFFMKILAINTVYKNYSVAFLSSNKIIIYSILNKNNIYKLINNILYNANVNIDKVDLLVFNNGPGSFNGIRLSAAFANVINIFFSTNILGISNLDILLYKTYKKQFNNNIIVIIFNKNKFYLCQYFFFNKILSSINKKEYYLNNIKEVINLLNNLKGIWYLYINKDFYINFFNLLFSKKINKNIKIFVKWFKIYTTAKDLIFCIKLFIKLKLFFLFKKIINLNNKINYFNNNIFGIN